MATLLTFLRVAVVDLQHHKRRDLNGCQGERPLLALRSFEPRAYTRQGVSTGTKVLYTSCRNPRGREFKLLAGILRIKSCLRFIFCEVCCFGYSGVMLSVCPCGACVFMGLYEAFVLPSTLSELALQRRRPTSTSFISSAAQRKKILN